MQFTLYSQQHSLYLLLDFIELLIMQEFVNLTLLLPVECYVSTTIIPLFCLTKIFL